MNKRKRRVTIQETRTSYMFTTLLNISLTKRTNENPWGREYIMAPIICKTNLETPPWQ